MVIKNQWLITVMLQWLSYSYAELSIFLSSYCASQWSVRGVSFPTCVCDVLKLLLFAWLDVFVCTSAGDYSCSHQCSEDKEEDCVDSCVECWANSEDNLKGKNKKKKRKNKVGMFGSDQVRLTYRHVKSFTFIFTTVQPLFTLSVVSTLISVIT